jgi:hypothetical protein
MFNRRSTCLSTAPAGGCRNAKEAALNGYALTFLLAIGAFLVILIVAWVVTVTTIGERERRRHDAERLRQLLLEDDLRELRKQMPNQKDKWLLDAQGMEALRAQAPDRYPPMTGGQTPDEFWAHWTPARVDEWREKSGIAK